MGMGRSSSRIATRRIANYNDTANYNELDQLIEATGLIPNHHHHSNNNTNNNRSNDSYQTNVITAKTNDNDLISIINSVATATMPNSEAINPTSSCCSSVVDIHYQLRQLEVIIIVFNYQPMLIIQLTINQMDQI